MKILFVSMASPHFFRWAAQLEGEGYELYWFDVFDSGSANPLFKESITSWRYRWDFPGRQYLKGNFSMLTGLINIMNERNISRKFEKELERIQPDVVHSFVLHSGVLPIYGIMCHNPKIKWIYSSWGSDLYAREKLLETPDYANSFFRRIQFLFTDCQRDLAIAKSLGFAGEILGVYPGGGGIDLEKWEQFVLPWEGRNSIIVKGYQNDFGKCIQVLKALITLQDCLEDYNIIVFGADKEVFDFVEEEGLWKWENFNCLGKIPHYRVMQLFGTAKIYIGNSLSDGIPNTLLEAICMGAFPIQTNPGRATEEIVANGFNGVLINDAEDVEEIKSRIMEALYNINLRRGVDWNLEKIKPNLERKLIRNRVLNSYAKVEKSKGQKNVVEL